MDFSFTEEQQMLKSNVRKFLDSEIAPVVDEHEKKGPLTKSETTGFIGQLMPFGYLLCFLPEDCGGSGLEAKTNGILVEELGRVWASLAGTIFIAAGFFWLLNEAGHPDQKKRLMPLAASGDYIGCLAITEPDVGSDVSGVKTTATLSGQHYVMNGTKTWISNGTIADAAFVLATTDKSLGALGMSFFLVEKNQSPFDSRELHKLGLRCFPTSELSFSDCKVPKENPRPGGLWRRYGTVALGTLEAIRRDPRMAEVIVETSEYLRCELDEAARREMVVTLDDFLRGRSKIALVVRQEEIRRAPGLREACRILFGDQAEARRTEYFGSPP